MVRKQCRKPWEGAGEREFLVDGVPVERALTDSSIVGRVDTLSF